MNLYSCIKILQKSVLKEPRMNLPKFGYQLTIKPNPAADPAPGQMNSSGKGHLSAYLPYPRLSERFSSEILALSSFQGFSRFKGGSSSCSGAFT